MIITIFVVGDLISQNKLEVRLQHLVLRSLIYQTFNNNKSKNVHLRPIIFPRRKNFWAKSKNKKYLTFYHLQGQRYDFLWSFLKKFVRSEAGFSQITGFNTRKASCTNCIFQNFKLPEVQKTLSFLKKIFLVGAAPFPFRDTLNFATFSYFSDIS